MKKTLTYALTVIAVTVILILSVSALNTDAYNTVYKGLSESAAEIDLSAYSLTDAELAEIFEAVMQSSPELFYVEGGYEYEYTDAGSSLTVTKMLPKYSLTDAELETAKATYSKFISEITAGIKSTWSDLEKALYIHDQIVLRQSYNTSISDVYNFAKKGYGNCTAYSLSFLAACNKVGITCETVSSTSMSHMWNMIKLNGKWYHIDVTWDDPVNDLEGRVLHTNFLKSDAGIKATSTPHSDWESKNTCTDGKYDSAAWNSVNSAFVFESGAWYAINGKTASLAKYNLGSSSVTDLAPIEDKWFVYESTTQVYNDPYSGIGATSGLIYFNSPTEILSYNVKTGAVSVVYTLTDTSAGYIYFISVSGKTLTYYLSTSPTVTQPKSGKLDLNIDESKYTVTFQVNGEPIGALEYAEGEEIMPPDVGKVDGFVFVGWEDLPDVMPAENITVEAILEVCTHETADNVVIIEATCTTDGEGNVVCTDCGHIISDYVIEGKHGFGDWKTITEADCNNDGLRRRYCPKCGEMTEEEVIPAYEAHRFGDWVILKEATETEDGERQRVCERCEYIDKQTYSLVSDPTETETETESGSSDDTSSNVGGNSSGTTGDAPDSTDTPAQSGGSKIKDVFVYLTIIVIVISCVIGIYLIYRYVFAKPKQKQKKGTPPVKKGPPTRTV